MENKNTPFRNLVNPIPTIGAQAEAMNRHVQQAINGLSLTIYTKLATEYVAINGPPDHEKLQGLAKKSMTAAKAYFEGLGIIEE